ncbi:class I SAM-dependent methyltransferase [Patescibacteria group bacterium]|nr:class I SAM-dependent methyltransferase [Patescibacteria group bacterium]
MERYKERIKATTNLLKKINLAENARYLDIGCHSGKMTVTNAKEMNIDLVNTYGVDWNKEALEQASGSFKVANIDIEKERLPYPDNYFDVVTVSEVFEHLRDINFVLDEIHRVLKTNGFLFISMPNLAALHNRILLLFGRQPRCISLSVGSHFRGFTFPAWKKLLSTKEFQVIKKGGAGLYPISSFAIWTLILAIKK